MGATSKAALGLLAVVLLGACAWAAVFLYWQVQINGALRSLETQTTPPFPSAADRTEAHQVLDRAGCRALPYLVGALDPARPPHFLATASSWWAFQTPTPGENVHARVEEWAIRPEDSAADRAKKCNAIRAWWKLHGHESHQTWRIWSRACATR